MPYIAPSIGPGGIIPRKKITKIKRDRPSASSSRFKPSQPEQAEGQATTSNITEKLASTQLAELPTSSSSPHSPHQRLAQTEAEQQEPQTSPTSSSHRSSFDSQLLGEASSLAQSPHPASVLSIPSLAGDTTDASASIASPKQANIILREDDEYEDGTDAQGLSGVADDAEDDGLERRQEEISSSSASSASSPYGFSASTSGAMTPLTAATSIDDDSATSLARYKESLWTYTQGLYIQAKQRAQRKESIDAYTQSQFGANSPDGDKKAAKRARARHLNSFD